jgi:hypothetical protein
MECYYYNRFNGPVVKELSSKDIEQQDAVDNAIYKLLCELTGKELLWDISVIHEIFDVIREKVYKRYGIVIPYAEVGEES